MGSNLDDLPERTATATRRAEAEGSPDAENWSLVQLDEAIARIDQRIQAQTRALREHPAFRRLESAWRGLAFLAERIATGPRLRLAVLNLSMDELRKDVADTVRDGAIGRFLSTSERAPDLLLADFEFHHGPCELPALRGLAMLCERNAIALLAAAGAKLLGLGSLRELSRQSQKLSRTLQALEYITFRAFREESAASWVCLAVPELMIAPGVSGSAAHALAVCIARAQNATGWPHIAADGEEYGELRELPGPVAIDLSYANENALAGWGLSCLLASRGSDRARFSALPTCQSTGSRAAVGMDLLSMLCISRLVRRLLAALRQLPRPIDRVHLRELCQRWLNDLSDEREDDSTALRRQYPLRNATVCVDLEPWQSGMAVVSLRLRLPRTRALPPASVQISFEQSGVY